MGSIPGQGSKIPHAMQWGQKNKKKRAKPKWKNKQKSEIQLKLEKQNSHLKNILDVAREKWSMRKSSVGSICVDKRYITGRNVAWVRVGLEGLSARWDLSEHKSEVLQRKQVSYSAQAVITKYHGLSGLNLMYICIRVGQFIFWWGLPDLQMAIFLLCPHLVEREWLLWCITL